MLFIHIQRVFDNNIFERFAFLNNVNVPYTMFLFIFKKFSQRESKMKAGRRKV